MTAWVFYRGYGRYEQRLTFRTKRGALAWIKADGWQSWAGKRELIIFVRGVESAGLRRVTLEPSTMSGGGDAQTSRHPSEGGVKPLPRVQPTTRTSAELSADYTRIYGDAAYAIDPN